MTSVFIRSKEKAETQRKTQYEDGARIRVMYLTSQGTPKLISNHQKLRERHVVVSLSQPPKVTISANTLILDF